MLPLLCQSVLFFIFSSFCKGNHRRAVDNASKDQEQTVKRHMLQNVFFSLLSFVLGFALVVGAGVYFYVFLVVNTSEVDYGPTNES